ncbi:Hypothetical predicted protein [Octopus vulgaris]|uniref:Uncharacterized protein n=1 Tax=Octopus vulgaris TaxID=6645 RepID=A0AA36BAX7_OCTVU|nr:Hypothetical predicted protein [Octopus vulgaris]
MDYVSIDKIVAGRFVDMHVMSGEGMPDHFLVQDTTDDILSDIFRKIFSEIIFVFSFKRYSVKFDNHSIFSDVLFLDIV